MIISHKYKYLFIEIPLTGSWAIRHELCAYYDGQPILHKHASYPEFRKIATDEGKKYFVFATVRNPLDAIVSNFFKYKTDHKGTFSNSEASLKSHIIDYADVKFYEYTQTSKITFESAFLRSKVWERPYSDMIEVSSDHLDFVIRYERLQQDFAQVLRLLDVEPVRLVPVTNKTQNRKTNWQSYYTPPMIEKAKRICGPFMQKWDYKFPPEWGDHEVSSIKKLEFRLANIMKKIYLVHFRYNDKPYAQTVRKFHAQLRKIM